MIKMVSKGVKIILVGFMAALLLAVANLGFWLYKFRNYIKTISDKSIMETASVIWNIVPRNNKFIFLAQFVLLIIFVIIFYVMLTKNIKEVGWTRKSFSKGNYRSKTDLDRLYDILKEKKILKIKNIERVFNVDAHVALEWCKVLENANLAAIDYPRFGKQILTLAEKEEEDIVANLVKEGKKSKEKVVEKVNVKEVGKHAVVQKKVMSRVVSVPEEEVTVKDKKVASVKTVAMETVKVEEKRKVVAAIVTPKQVVENNIGKKVLTKVKVKENRVEEKERKKLEKEKERLEKEKAKLEKKNVEIAKKEKARIEKQTERERKSAEKGRERTEKKRIADEKANKKLEEEQRKLEMKAMAVGGSSVKKRMTKEGDKAIREVMKEGAALNASSNDDNLARLNKLKEQMNG